MEKAPGIRARNRRALQDQIIAVANQHLISHGAAALSLRAIARDLGMASSAIYRYVASRDELLTVLIINAYDALADDVDAALAGHVAGPEERFAIIARTTRSWALAHPHQYALIYGSPVPGYDAPGERTNVAGTRVLQHLLRVLVDLPQREAGDAKAAAAVAPLLELLRSEGHELNAGVAAAGLIGWTLILGSITAEVFEQFGANTIGDKDAMFELTIKCGLQMQTG